MTHGDSAVPSPPSKTPCAHIPFGAKSITNNMKSCNSFVVWLCWLNNVSFIMFIVVILIGCKVTLFFRIYQRFRVKSKEWKAQRAQRHSNCRAEVFFVPC